MVRFSPFHSQTRTQGATFTIRAIRTRRRTTVACRSTSLCCSQLISKDRRSAASVALHLVRGAFSWSPRFNNICTAILCRSMMCSDAALTCDHVRELVCVISSRDTRLQLISQEVMMAWTSESPSRGLDGNYVYDSGEIIEAWDYDLMIA